MVHCFLYYAHQEPSPITSRFRKRLQKKENRHTVQHGNATGSYPNKSTLCMGLTPRSFFSLTLNVKNNRKVKKQGLVSSLLV